MMLSLPESAVDLIEVDVGGGFGARGEFYPEDFLIPFAARHVGGPVRWLEDRREHLMATNHAREMHADMEIACHRDGTVLGVRGRIDIDLGAYARTNGLSAPRNVRVCQGPRDCSSASAMARTSSSSKGRPMICTPIGRPSFEKLIGTEAPGKPVKLSHCEKRMVSR